MSKPERHTTVNGICRFVPTRILLGLIALLVTACSVPRAQYVGSSSAGAPTAADATDTAAIDDTRFMNEVLAMWFESDPAARRQAIASHFDPDIRFFDHDGTLVGYDALERFSDSLQKRFPHDRFTMSDRPERMANGVRAFWTLGRGTGMDFALFEGGKIKTMYVFVHPSTGIVGRRAECHKDRPLKGPDGEPDRATGPRVRALAPPTTESLPPVRTRATPRASDATYSGTPSLEE